VDFLVNRARSFIFTTAPVPAAATAATVAINLVQSVEGKTRCDQLWQVTAELHSALRTSHSALTSAIVPIILGDEANAVAAATKLREQGFFVPAIRYPTVARGAARLRVTLTAAHTAKDVATLTTALHASRITHQAAESPIVVR